MPKIPQYEIQTQARGAGLGPGPTVAPSGRGAALAAFGEHAEAAVDVFHADGVARANAAATQLDEEAQHLLTMEATEMQPGAEGFTPSFLKKFDELASKVQSEASEKASIFNRRKVAEFIGAKAQQIRTRVEHRAEETEAVERVRFRDELHKQSSERAGVILESDPDRWKQVAVEQMAAIHDSGMPPIAAQQAQRRLELNVAQGAAIGYAKRDPRAALAELFNPDTESPIYRNLSGPARDRVRAVAEGQLIESNVASIVDTYTKAGTDAGARALAAVSQSDLSPSLQDEVRRGVSSRLSQFRELRRQENVDAIASVERSIANDTAGGSAQRQVDELYQRGALTPAEYGNYVGQIESGTVRRMKDEAAAEEIAIAMRSGLPLDPRNEQQRKGLSSAFAQDVREVPIGSESWQATAMAYASRTRMLPQQALAWTRQTMRSPDPQIAAAGAQFYGAIAAASPDAVGEIDEDTKAFAATVNSMIEAGTAPQRAVETARTNVFDLKPEIIKRRKEEYALQAKQSDAVLDQLIDSEFDPGLFASPPAASAGIKADFAAQAERYYQKAGDITIARQLAWNDVKRVYGPTNVNGSAVMSAFPVERFGVKPEDVRADIGAFLKDSPQADGSAAAEIYVVPDSITMRDVRNALDGRPVQPTYKLVSKSGDLVLDRHGVPKRYTLPSGDELARRLKAADAKAEADGRALVEEARRRRADERATREAWQRSSTAPGVHR